MGASASQMGRSWTEEAEGRCERAVQQQHREFTGSVEPCGTGLCREAERGKAREEGGYRWWTAPSNIKIGQCYIYSYYLLSILTFNVIVFLTSKTH